MIMDNMVKCVFIGCVNGNWKDERTGKEISTYTIYLGKPMVDKNGDSYGYGYKPVSVKVDKDVFNEFTTIDFGIEFFADVFTYKNQYGNYSYKLVRYEL